MPVRRSVGGDVGHAPRGADAGHAILVGGPGEQVAEPAARRAGLRGERGVPGGLADVGAGDGLASGWCRRRPSTSGSEAGRSTSLTGCGRDRCRARPRHPSRRRRSHGGWRGTAAPSSLVPPPPGPGALSQAEVLTDAALGDHASLRGGRSAHTWRTGGELRRGAGRPPGRTRTSRMVASGATACTSLGVPHLLQAGQPRRGGRAAKVVRMTWIRAAGRPNRASSPPGPAGCRGRRKGLGAGPVRRDPPAAPPYARGRSIPRSSSGWMP